MRSARAPLQQRRAGAGELRFQRRIIPSGRPIVGRPDARQDRDVLPVAGFGHPVRGSKPLRDITIAEDLADLRRSPREGQALDAVGVGVLARGECPVVPPQLSKHVFEDRDCDLAVPATGSAFVVAAWTSAAELAEDVGRVEIHTGQLGVVVEHLLEVGHEPASVRGVAMETAAELIVDPAVRHLLEGEADHRVGLAVAGSDPTKEVLEGHRLRELRGAAPRSITPVEPGIQPGIDRPEERAVDGHIAACRGACLVDQRRYEPLARRQDLTALVHPCLRHPLEDLAE